MKSSGRLTLKRLKIISLMVPLSHRTRILAEEDDRDSAALAELCRYERGCTLINSHATDFNPENWAESFDLVIAASNPSEKDWARWNKVLRPGGVVAGWGEKFKKTASVMLDTGWRDAFDCYPGLSGHHIKKEIRTGIRVIQGYRKPGSVTRKSFETAESESFGISLIIPAFNEAGYIGQMLDSANAAAENLTGQTGATCQIIVSDNASTDDTAGIAARKGALVVLEPKRQIAAARNKGASVSRGKYLVFSDADNILSENLLTSIYTAMETGKYSGGGVTVRMEEGSLFGSFVQSVFNMLSRLTGYSGGVIYTDRERFFRIGGFNEYFYTNEDGLLIRELAREAKRYNLSYHTVRDAWIITSNRKFVEMNPLEMLRQSRDLATGKRDPRKREDCSIWYERE